MNLLSFKISRKRKANFNFSHKTKKTNDVGRCSMPGTLNKHATNYRATVWTHLSKEKNTCVNLLCICFVKYLLNDRFLMVTVNYAENIVLSDKLNHEKRNKLILK